MDENKMGKKKWMQHPDFPGGHPSQYYSGSKALNFIVLTGLGVVAGMTASQHGGRGGNIYISAKVRNCSLNLPILL